MKSTHGQRQTRDESDGEKHQRFVLERIEWWHFAGKKEAPERVCIVWNHHKIQQPDDGHDAPIFKLRSAIVKLNSLEGKVVKKDEEFLRLPAPSRSQY